MIFSIGGTISAFTCFHPSLLLTGMVRIDAFNQSLNDISSSSLATKGVVCRFASAFGVKTSQTPCTAESSHSASCQKVSHDGPGVSLSSSVEVMK